MGREFEILAETIMHRWAAERDLWVSPSELQHARAYLASHGVHTRERPDGTFDIRGDCVQQSCDAASLVLLGLRRVHAARHPSLRDAVSYGPVGQPTIGRATAK